MRSLIIAALAVSSSGASAASLHLACLGAGSASRSTVTSAYVTNSEGDSGWGQAVGTREVPFEDQVNIDIDGDAGKIRMPRSMLPKIHGGENGWFELRNIKTTDSEITGSAAVSIINSPKVRLDRITGRISISGKSGDYAGVCEPYDPATAARKF